MQFGVNKHKDNKIAWAGGASAICSLETLQVFFTQNYKGKYGITCY